PCSRGSRRRGWRVQRGKASLETTASTQPILRSIAGKTRQFQRTTSAAARTWTKLLILLVKSSYLRRGDTMAGKGKCRQQPHKTISDAERSRRQSAVNYARASVGLEGFSLSEADEAHAQRFVDGQISLQEFVQPRADALALRKSSS